MERADGSAQHIVGGRVMVVDTVAMIGAFTNSSASGYSDS